MRSPTRTSDTYTIAGELPLFSGQVSPAQLRHAYGIDQISFTGPGGTTVTGDGSGQTIAIVEEGVDPTLGADLTTFDQFFGIPAPPSFQVVDQNGVTTQNLDIVGEASLDVEWAHAVAPGASIIVYNAAYDPNNATASFENLIAAMQQASKLPGVSVVTLSYGEPESSLAASGLNQQSFDSNFTTPGVTFLAASGDSGIYGNGGRQVAADYPAASPNIVSVGGTSIVIDAAGDYPGTGSSGEVAWGDGTQSGTARGRRRRPERRRARAGVAERRRPRQHGSRPALARCPTSRWTPGPPRNTTSSRARSAALRSRPSAVGWLGDAGTSAASPIWAGLIAIADQGRVLAGGTPLTGYTQTLPALYSLPAADFHDILHGNNGDPAGPGYDLATGLGTPVANLLVPALAGYGLAQPDDDQDRAAVERRRRQPLRPDRPGRGQPGESGQRRHRDGRPGEQPRRRNPGRHPHGDGRERPRHVLRPDPEPARHRLYLDGDRQCHRGRPDDDRHHRHGRQQRHQGRRDGVPRRAGLRPDGDA